MNELRNVHQNFLSCNSCISTKLRKDIDLCRNLTLCTIQTDQRKNDTKRKKRNKIIKCDEIKKKLKTDKSGLERYGLM